MQTGRTLPRLPRFRVADGLQAVQDIGAAPSDGHIILPYIAEESVLEKLLE